LQRLIDYTTMNAACRMRFLFVKSRLEWPRTYGHDVHGYEMMRALAMLGHTIALATDVEPTSQAVDGLNLDARWTLTPDTSAPSPRLSYLQERYRRYWGIDRGRIAALGRTASDWKADVLVVVGLEILPYLAAPTAALRVWYAADEWVLHYVSQLSTDPAHAITHIKQATIKGVYERAYGSLMDRVWVVSGAERRAMRLVAGISHVDVLPNGVDTATFSPRPVDPIARSAIFWGRLGFGPNLQALRWFCGQVWPRVRAMVPDAAFTILGADPPQEVLAYDGQNGMRVRANLPDLRPEISRGAVVVMPFVSGGGIKNKFLEAAAMGRPIVATTRSTRGLTAPMPIVLADEPDAFARAIIELWADTDRAAALGRDARYWVETHHTWSAAAQRAIDGLRSR
jgi:glycosyltransferase involved in cell wall biosynthesis